MHPDYGFKEFSRKSTIEHGAIKVGRPATTDAAIECLLKSSRFAGPYVGSFQVPANDQLVKVERIPVMRDAEFGQEVVKVHSKRADGERGYG